ncbi:MAG: cobalamin-dependent protein, partial [Chloroflexi bacterium]|nr:cobalamin-dependent protein [Chloroflexota bacterium]
MGTQGSDPAPQLVEEFVAAAVAGDERGVSRIIHESLGQGSTVQDVYLGLVAPALVEVGDRWHDGSLSVADEHLATEITARDSQELRSAAHRKPALGKRVTVTAAPGERHALGGRIVADFLYLDGWEVDFLGADMPAEDLAAFVKGTGPDLVAISVVLETNVAGAANAIKRVKEVAPRLPVMVGGPGVPDPIAAASLGAQGHASDAEQAVRVARSLLGITLEFSLDQLLTAVGERIHESRRSKRWSQQRLADAAGLDRTYVSAVENGHQNLTLSALHRLA